MAAAERKRGWRWSFVPRRLLRNERFLGLSHTDSNVLLRLYLSCTGHGRFEAGPISLAITLGLIEPGLDLLGRVRHLASLGFVNLYEHDGAVYGRIDGYDKDAPADLVRKRGPSILPEDPAISAKRLPSVCQPSAKSRGEEKR